MDQMSGGSGSGSSSNIPTTIPTAISEESSALPTAVIISDSQRSISGAPSATPSPVLSPPGKIYGRNYNNTVISTSAPSNEAELQLYRVLQRASLLAYYDTLLEMGGDDVQQLCDAGEDEFLEIMALVGMASKPLHVRRLQKSLHEWVNNPSAFQTPLPGIDPTQLMYSPEPSTSRSKCMVSPGFTPTPLISTAHTAQTSTGLSSLATGISSQVTSSSPLLTPTLTETQISKLIIGAERLVRQLPQLEPKPQTSKSSKKGKSRDLEQVMAMTENDPRRMDEIRKYAAIYGRFDCKRRPEKPLTLHEVCVNEAAAQICTYIPALLTRRDKLFELARQVVRDAGFGHSASIARFGLAQQTQRTDESEPGNTKRAKLSSDNTSSDFNKDFIEESRNNLFAMYQKFGRPFDLSDIAKFSLSRSDYEDNDSRFSFSNSSSPPLQLNGSEADSVITVPVTSPTAGQDFYDNGKENSIQKSPSCGTIESVPNSPLGIQIISASGSHIIAVANPALAMSPALNSESMTIKRETTSPDI